MKRFILILIFTLAEVFIIVKPAFAAVTFADVKIVYRTLCRVEKKCLPLYVITDTKIGANASSSTQGVMITTDMMKDLKNRNQLAVVLAHELGHIHNGDVTNSWHTYSMEYKADKYGAYLAQKAGFNRCNGIKWLVDDMKKYGDDTSIDHPKDSLRLNRINYGCEKK